MSGACDVQLIHGSPSYTLLDTGNGERLERVGTITVRRPDPNVLWPITDSYKAQWQGAQARYLGDKEQPWILEDQALLEGWNVSYPEVKLVVHARPTPFRHLGYFPEQYENWCWLRDELTTLISQGVKKPRVLNLFGYTGAASIVAAQAGAEVVHVDASKPAIAAARRNSELSGKDLPVRWIVEDAMKFLAREERRGSTYDIILLDPPVFGRGTKGEIWRLEQGLSELLRAVVAVSAKGKVPKILLNFYATQLYPGSVKRVLQDQLPEGTPISLLSVELEEESRKVGLQTGFILRT